MTEPISHFTKSAYNSDDLEALLHTFQTTETGFLNQKSNIALKKLSEAETLLEAAQKANDPAAPTAALCAISEFLVREHYVGEEQYGSQAQNAKNRAGALRNQAWTALNDGWNKNNTTPEFWALQTNMSRLALSNLDTIDEATLSSFVNGFKEQAQIEARSDNSQQAPKWPLRIISPELDIMPDNINEGGLVTAMNTPLRRYYTLMDALITRKREQGQQAENIDTLLLDTYESIKTCEPLRKQDTAPFAELEGIYMNFHGLYDLTEDKYPGQGFPERVELDEKLGLLAAERLRDDTMPNESYRQQVLAMYACIRALIAERSGNDTRANHHREAALTHIRENGRITLAKI